MGYTGQGASGLRNRTGGRELTEKEKRVIEMYQQGYRVYDILSKEDIPSKTLYMISKQNKVALRGRGYRKVTIGRKV